MLYAKCQVFTPINIVNDQLDYVGYTENLFGKKVLENSCGNGNFLSEIVHRYIIDSRKNGYSVSAIRQGLNSDIFGYEIDKTHRDTCIANLNSISREYEILNVDWNIYPEDALRANVGHKFDFVIGNPPYIKYSDLDKETRRFIKRQFTVCSEGKPDYYYAFIQSSIDLLNENGKLAYIVPSNIFKTTYARMLREYLEQYLSEIFDYKNTKIFGNKLTASAIILCDKGVRPDKITYHDMKNQSDSQVSYSNGKWLFDFSASQSAEGKAKSYRFGDFFTASYPIATLLNEAFIIKNFEIMEGYIRVGDFLIEKDLLRKAVSPKSQSKKRNEFIIFPYIYKEGSIVRYTEEEFGMKFPEAFSYLQNYKERLMQRDADLSAKWYEYGRSQALAHIPQDKLLISTLVTGNVKVYTLSSEYVPYSGIYIVAHNEKPLSLAKKILESPEFMSYVKSIGIHANGKSIRIAANDINNYCFDMTSFSDSVTV